MKTLFLLFFSLSALAAESTLIPSNKVSNSDTCVQLLENVKGPSFVKNNLVKVCARVQQLDGCTSVNGTPIVHFEKTGYDRRKKRILVFSLIHGDEAGAGSLVRYWLERLNEIDPRNDWRIVPVLNPDGYKAKTRTNASNVDLNRNFPTRDWDDMANINWKKHTSSNPRRFPGTIAGGEPEVKCAVKHLEDFKPDFVVSIHTPLGVLDFDGPKVKPPAFSYLPWKSLGNFPGSLGRFMWAERSVPVLTTELKPTMPSTFDTFDKLQDVLGELAKTRLGPQQVSAFFSDH
jgi:murein peptide amidase A